MRHGQNTKGQGSGESPLILRPPNQALPSLMQPHGGWLVEDDISSRAQPNNRPLISVKESNVAKSDKHQVQSKLISPSIPVSSPTGLLSQSSQVSVEEV